MPRRCSTAQASPSWYADAAARAHRSSATRRLRLVRARNAAVTVVTTLIGAICISVGVGMLINGVPAAATTVKWSLYSSFYVAGVVVLVILFRFTACERITKRDPVLIMT